MYDDLTKDKWTADGTDKIVKTIWDKKWRSGDQQSQIIMTSNRKCPPGQMKTRIKEIHFPATFERTNDSRIRLMRHLEGECNIFYWFSKLYFDYSAKNPDHIEDDESFIGRIVFQQLYSLCDRNLPNWLCLEPLENLYSKTAIDILKGICRKDVWFREKSGEFQMCFRKTLESYEIKGRYWNGIPPEYNADYEGRSVFIRSKDKFLRWLSKSMEFLEESDTVPRYIRKMMKRSIN
jgi:hypothetical protein